MQEDSKLGPEAHYQAQLNQGRFLIQRCSHCVRHIFYPRVICPHCGGAALRWVEAGGAGTVYSTTTVRRKAEAGGDYDVSLIDLDEGVRMMSRVDGISPTEVKIGMRVRARVIDDKGAGLVVFIAEDGR